MKRPSRQTPFKDARAKHWRSQVLTRDNHTCLSCEESGNKAYPLKPRHILPIKEFPTLAYEIDNGISLCSKCYTWIKSGGEFKDVCLQLVMEQKFKIQKDTDG